MKAPKYILFTDHFADWNANDEFIEIEAKNFLQAFTTASNMLEKDNTLYLIRIYEAVQGTRSKEYARIANVRSNCEIEIMNDYSITRHTYKNTVWYE